MDEQVKYILKKKIASIVDIKQDLLLKVGKTKFIDMITEGYISSVGHERISIENEAIFRHYLSEVIDELTGKESNENSF